MRADTHDGPEQMLHVRGLIHCCSSHVRRSWNSVLQRTAGPYIWHVPEELIGAGKVRSSGLTGRSHRVLESTRLTHRRHSPEPLLDHLVGRYEQSRWHGESKRLRSSKIDGRFEPSGCLHWKVRRAVAA